MFNEVRGYSQEKELSLGEFFPILVGGTVFLILFWGL